MPTVFYARMYLIYGILFQRRVSSARDSFMQGENGERWRTLCQQITTEQDPDKLIELATEITRLLDEKEERLKGLKQAVLRSA